MPENPLNPIESPDPDLSKAVENTRKLPFGNCALPRKYKYLRAMVLDATHGADAGVRILAQAAIRAGATKEEVADALRVATYIKSMGQQGYKDDRTAKK